MAGTFAATKCTKYRCGERYIHVVNIKGPTDDIHPILKNYFLYFDNGWKCRWRDCNDEGKEYDVKWRIHSETNSPGFLEIFIPNHGWIRIDNGKIVGMWKTESLPSTVVYSWTPYLHSAVVGEFVWFPADYILLEYEYPLFISTW